MHRVKGMATLVEAWAAGPLRERANLLIIGGDLEHPSLDEREQLDRIDAAVPADDRDRAGLILAGHRPNDVAALWLAAARFGLPGLAAPGGVYVCASVKEEFGIALLEAMATGLMVVAPDGGGPATYVQDGVTGVLTQTWDPARLEAGVAAALDVAAAPDRRAGGCRARDGAHELHDPGDGHRARTGLPRRRRRGGRAHPGGQRGQRGHPVWAFAVTLLVISPDYASHLLPLATLATAWRDAGERVVVATGPATDPIVREFGLERYDLPLGRGSNARVIRAEEQPDEESDSLRGFFDATRRGMVPTLALSGERAAHRPDVGPGGCRPAHARRGRRGATRRDHRGPPRLQRAARAAGRWHRVCRCRARPSRAPSRSRARCTAIPPFWPAAFTPGADELADLRALCDEVSARFTAEWNRTARALDPAAPLTRRRVRRARRPRAVQLPGAPSRTVTDERCPRTPSSAQPAGWRPSTIRSKCGWHPRASSPTSASAASSPCAATCCAASPRRSASIGMPAAIATGSTPSDELGPIPDGLARARVPAAGAAAVGARLAVTHGGNNSVTEAIGQGVPLLVLPFSTDQFAGAAAIERTGIGRALDPNAADVDELAAALAAVRDLSGSPLLRVASRASRPQRPARAIAYELLTAREPATS